MAELLPCPFCGGKAEVFDHKCKSAFVDCLQCGAEGRVCSTEAEAVESWNRRVQPHVHVLPLDPIPPAEVTYPNWENWTGKYVEFTEEEKADLVRRAKQIEQEFWRKPDDMPPGCGIAYWVPPAEEVKPDVELG